MALSEQAEFPRMEDGLCAAVNAELAENLADVPLGRARRDDELLGEMLLELGDAALALQAFEASQQIEQHHFMGRYGAACAAEMAGDHEKMHGYYEQLVAVGAMADGACVELAAAQAFLAQEGADVTIQPSR